MDKSLVTFLTPCMGRLDHLKESLPLRANNDKYENIVIDWSCPDKTADWVKNNYPDVKVISIKNQDYYNSSKPRNKAIPYINTEYVCMADADLLISENFYEIFSLLSHDSFLVRVPTGIYTNKYQYKKPFLTRKERRKVFKNKINPVFEWIDEFGIKQSENGSLTGFIILSTKIFKEINGFNESFVGYGGEDIHLRAKLIIEKGLKEVLIKKGYVDSIPHSDSLRLKNHNELNNFKNFIKTRTYSGKIHDSLWGKLDWKKEVNERL